MYRKFVVGLIAVISLLVLTSAVFASTYGGTVIFTCVNADAAGNGPHTLDRDNTGVVTPMEALRVDITDGAGTLIYTLSFSNVLGTFAGGIGDFFYTTAPQYNPITFTLTSLAGNGLPQQVDYVAQGSCAGLPTVPGAGCTAGLPEGSVIGDMPFNTQAYWAPGQESPGVVINAGTYHVIGQDETGEWRKIMLGCNFLWVPYDSMGPSYQAPQNGAPLPTRVVN